MSDGKEYEGDDDRDDNDDDDDGCPELADDSDEDEEEESDDEPPDLMSGDEEEEHTVLTGDAYVDNKLAEEAATAKARILPKDAKYAPVVSVWEDLKKEDCVETQMIDWFKRIVGDEGNSYAPVAGLPPGFPQFCHATYHGTSSVDRALLPPDFMKFCRFVCKSEETRRAGGRVGGSSELTAKSTTAKAAAPAPATASKKQAPVAAAAATATATASSASAAGTAKPAEKKKKKKTPAAAAAAAPASTPAASGASAAASAPAPPPQARIRLASDVMDSMRDAFYSVTDDEFDTDDDTQAGGARGNRSKGAGDGADDPTSVALKEAERQLQVAMKVIKEKEDRIAELERLVQAAAV